MPPDMLLLNAVTTAPVVELTAARPTRAVPLTVVNWPPMYTVVLVASTDVAGPGPPVFAVKPVIVAPVVGLIEATLRLVTPLTLLKRPTMNSLVPSGEASTSSTPPPPNTGRNAVSMRPVSMLYAASEGWATVVVLVVVLLRMEVNVPAMKTRLPM